MASAVAVSAQGPWVGPRWARLLQRELNFTSDITRGVLDSGLETAMDAQWGSFRSTRAMVLPWERGFLRYILGTIPDPLDNLMATSVEWRGPVPPVPVPAMQAVVQGSKDHLQAPATRSQTDHFSTGAPNLLKGKQRRARKAEIAWPEKQEGKERMVISKWKWVVERADPRMCKVTEMLRTAKTAEESVEILNNVFGTKATGTLEKRAGSVLAYLRWSETADRRGDPLAFSEPLVYRYVEELRSSKAAPTKATSFLEAVPFTCELLGI